MKNHKILITGSTGFVGRNVLRALLEEGHLVTCLLRPDSDETKLAGLNADRVRADPFDLESLNKILCETEIVVHIGGITRGTSDQDYIHANVDYTYSLAQAFKASGKKQKFIYISSQAAFGTSPCNRPGTEKDPPRPVSAYGRSKLMAEECLREFTGFFNIWVLRSPSIYGPGETGLSMVWENIQKGRPVRMVWDYPMSMLYVSDLCSVICRITAGAFEAIEKNWNLYFITDGEDHTFKEICETAAKILGRRVSYIERANPFSILKALTCSAMGIFSDRFDRDAIKTYRRYNFDISCEKARRELGYKPAYTLREGLERTLAWYKDNGWF
jgi:nucleoside-diphosphate-sugar epimerase